MSFLPLVVVLKEKWAMKGNQQHFHVDMESSSGTADCVYMLSGGLGLHTFAECC